MTDRQIALLSLAVSVLTALWAIGWAIWLDRRLPPVHVTTNAVIVIEFPEPGQSLPQYRIRVTNVGSQPCVVTSVDLRLRAREQHSYDIIVPREWYRLSLPIKLEPGGFVDLPVIDLAEWRTSLERRYGGPREWWVIEVAVREAAGREFVTTETIPGYMPLK